MGTSNVQAGFLYDVPIFGTLAHSMIMSYEDEEDCAESKMISPLIGGPAQDILQMALKYREQLGWHKTILKELYAFISFAYAYPENFASLVDSYDTKESGVKNFICVSLAL